jgi:hypothetical protein
VNHLRNNHRQRNHCAYNQNHVVRRSNYRSSTDSHRTLPALLQNGHTFLPILLTQNLGRASRKLLNIRCFCVSRLRKVNISLQLGGFFYNLHVVSSDPDVLKVMQLVASGTHLLQRCT